MMIFGVRVDEDGRDKVDDALEDAFSAGKRVTIVTLNPEILLKARRDPAYRDTLNSFDLRVADGFGLFMAGVYHLKTIQRTTGRKILSDLLERADRDNQNATIALRRGGLTGREKTESVLKTVYPNLKATVFESSPDTVSSSDEAEIVVCCFGAPDQENWIMRNRDRFPKVKVMIGVGGALDVLVGSLPRSPSWLSSIGLEWVWRLVVQPRRWRRIARAVIVFPVVFVWDSFFDRKENA